jgi:hypothetical protein
MDVAFDAPTADRNQWRFTRIPIRCKHNMVWTSRFRAVLWFATGWVLIAIVVLIARLMAGQ